MRTYYVQIWRDTLLALNSLMPNAHGTLLQAKQDSLSYQQASSLSDLEIPRLRFGQLDFSGKKYT